MKRTVLLTIDDDRVDQATLKLRWPSYIHTDGKVLDYEHRWVDVPVPPDDQLTRDLDLLTTSGRNEITLGAANRVRAALGLGEESE